MKMNSMTHLFESRRGVIAELLIVIVLIASVALLVREFTSITDTPSVRREVRDVVLDLREQIMRALVDWLQEGITEDPVACNGLYPLSPKLDAYVARLEPFVERYLPDGAITDGTVTIETGALDDVALTDDGLVITLDDSKIVYDDGNIHAEDSLGDDLRFPIKLRSFATIVENWTMCDSGGLGARLESSLGTSCFYGKIAAPSCGQQGDGGGKLRLTQDDIDYMLNEAPSPGTVGRALKGAVGELNAFLNGSASCGGEPSGENLGIVCEYSIKELDVTFNIYPYSSENLPIIDPGSSYAKTADAKMFLAKDSSHVWALPSNRTIQHYRDEDLRCEDTAERIVVPSAVSYLPTVDLINTQRYQPIGIADFRNQQMYPIMLVNTTKGAKFRAEIICTDRSITLLGQPIEYRFSFDYGVKLHCGPPTGKPYHDEPVCAPCGGTAFEWNRKNCCEPQCTGGAQYTYCLAAWEWYRKNGREFTGDPHATDWIDAIYESNPQNWWNNVSSFCFNPKEKDCNGYTNSYRTVCCGGLGLAMPPGPDEPEPAWWSAHKDDPRGPYGALDICNPPAVQDSGRMNNACETASAAHATISPRQSGDKLVGINDPGSVTDHWCMFDNPLLQSLCIGQKSCDDVNGWTLGEYCVQQSCQGETSTCEANPPESAAKGVPCSNDPGGCFWCSDGTDGNPAGMCSFNKLKQDEPCQARFDSGVCRVNTCQENGPNGPGCQLAAEQPGPEAECTNELRSSYFADLYVCDKGTCDGQGHCVGEFDPEKEGERCGVVTIWENCAGGTQRCAYEEICSSTARGGSGGCEFDESSRTCEVCVQGGVNPCPGQCQEDNECVPCPT